MSKETKDAPAESQQEAKEVQVVKPEPESVPAVVQPVGIDALLAHAVTHNFDLDKLERLIAIRDSENAKQAKREFDEALSAFQLDVGEIVKNKDGWDKKYKYADLAQIERIIKAPRAKHGFSHKFKFAQFTDQNRPKIRVTLVLTHKGGHSEETTLEGFVDEVVTTGKESGKANMNGLQAGGAASTYLQRYAVIGGYGLTTAQSDTDGRPPKEAPPTEPVNGLLGDPGKPKTTPGQFAKLKERVAKEGRETIETALANLYLSPAQLKELFNLIPEDQRNPKTKD